MDSDVEEELGRDLDSNILSTNELEDLNDVALRKELQKSEINRLLLSIAKLRSLEKLGDLKKFLESRRGRLDFGEYVEQIERSRRKIDEAIQFPSNVCRSSIILWPLIVLEQFNSEHLLNMSFVEKISVALVLRISEFPLSLVEPLFHSWQQLSDYRSLLLDRVAPNSTSQRKSVLSVPRDLPLSSLRSFSRYNEALSAFLNDLDLRPMFTTALKVLLSILKNEADKVTAHSTGDQYHTVSAALRRWRILFREKKSLQLWSNFPIIEGRPYYYYGIGGDFDPSQFSDSMLIRNCFKHRTDIEIKPSKIDKAGLGAFWKGTSALAVGTVLDYYEGFMISECDVAELYPDESIDLDGNYMLHIGNKNILVDARWNKAWSRFINDGREVFKNNIAFINDGAIVSIRPIMPGDEILADYGKSFGWKNK